MIYRGHIKTNAPGTHDRIAPSMRKEARKSRKALTACYADFCAMLAELVPHDGATAVFECIDGNGYVIDRVRFAGKPDAFDLATDGYCSTPCGGVWYLEEGPDGLTDMVRAGRTESTARYLARRVQGK